MQSWDRGVGHHGEDPPHQKLSRTFRGGTVPGYTPPPWPPLAAGEKLHLGSSPSLRVTLDPPCGEFLASTSQAEGTVTKGSRAFKPSFLLA